MIKEKGAKMMSSFPPYIFLNFALRKSISPGVKSISLCSRREIGAKYTREIDLPRREIDSCCPECDFGEDCCREIDLPSRGIDFISQKCEKCLVYCMSWLGTYKTKAYKETKQYFWYLG